MVNVAVLFVIFCDGMNLRAIFSGSSIFLVCGGSLTNSPEGNFTSPGYDGTRNYSRNLNCEWTLSNSNQGNSSIYIDFEDFYLESHQDCQFDVLEFRVGEFHQGTHSPFPPQYSSDATRPTMKGVTGPRHVYIRSKSRSSSWGSAG